MKMKKNKIVLSALSLLLIASVFFVLSFNQSPLPSSDTVGIEYHSNVCVYKNDQLVQCDHNLLYDTGKELIENYLGDTGGASDEVDQISLCNATAGCQTPVAGASETFNTFSSCGMEKATGTYASVGTGNWTISNTFTSSCNNIVTNATRLLNTAGTNFAGNNFTSVTLQNLDQLTITWNIWVT